ncbi:hypothetical protein C0989_012472 [Termitomyces sp. Mn162]|nr:hypothetical protein C0989_012472 [Termitomyces sp. Mn162]KAH0580256.1 hypothetical protein H2248_001774 [Termitomyces sp. 'cryptogamus']
MASDEEYSDLTDLSDDEFKGSPSKSKKKGRDSSPAGYRIRNALKVPRATTYTAQALYDQMHSDDIKLDPEYQRDVVWPDAKMIGLIDSIFRNFYVPPVIFSVVSYNDGSEKRICIDGKQRLTSIQRFMDGLIPHKDPITNQKLFYTDTGGGRLKRKILPQKYRKLFANKQIVCVEYTDVSDSDEREIFQRVQLGMALTPAEKLQVVNTPRSAFIRSLLTHFLTSSSSYSEDGAGSLAHFDWERTRGSDYRSISQMVFCLYTFPAFAPPGKATDLKRATSIKSLALVSTLEKFLSEPAPFTDDFEENVKSTLRVVGAMASDQGLIGSGRDKMEIRGVFRNPAKMAPVELVLAGLLVGSHMGQVGCTAAIGGAKESKIERGEREKREAEGRRKLAEGIRDMRAEVRETHVDIRMNTRVARTMLDFVRGWKPSTVTASSSSSTVIATSSSSSIGKRKRTASNAKDLVEDGQVTSDDENRVGNGKDNDDEVPLRLKFQKIARISSPSKSQSQPPAPSAPPSSVPSFLPPKPLSIPTPGPASQKPDRMAALRAAKMQMQGGGGGLPLPPQSQGSGSLTNISANASANGWGQDTGWGSGNAGWQVDPPWGRG